MDNKKTTLKNLHITLSEYVNDILGIEAKKRERSKSAQIRLVLTEWAEKIMRDAKK